MHRHKSSDFHIFSQETVEENEFFDKSDSNYLNPEVERQKREANNQAIKMQVPYHSVQRYMIVRTRLSCVMSRLGLGLAGLTPGKTHRQVVSINLGFIPRRLLEVKETIPSGRAVQNGDGDSAHIFA